ncbi:MAG: ATP-binding protein [Candidatus Sericytochromatia bacterium]
MRTPLLTEKLLQQARIGSWTYDVQTGKWQWAPEVCAVFGLPPNFAPTPGQLETSFSPASHQELEALRARLQTVTEPFELECELSTQQRTLLVRVLGQPDLKAGRLLGVSGTLQDITGHKREREQQLQQELSEVSKTYQLATLGSSAGFWQWNDLHESAMCWSETFLTLLGYRPDELAATVENFRQLVHPEDYARALALLEAHLHTRSPFRLEYRLRTRSGRYKWFLASGQAERDTQGRPLRMVGSIVDIHAQKQAQLALQRSLAYQKELNAIAFDIGMSRAECLRQGCQILCAYFALPCCSISQIQGGVLEIVALEDAKSRIQGRPVLPGDTFPLAGSLVGQIYDREGVVTLDELVSGANPAEPTLINSYRLKSLIGSPYWVQGEAHGVVACYGYEPRPQDFSCNEREFLQIFCQWLGFMLERHFFIEHLQKLNSNKDQLLAVIAHDLRNPLASIVSAKRRLERYGEQQPDPRMLTVIENSCHQANQLIEELLTAAELEEDPLKLALEPLNLRSFVQEALQSFEPLTAAKQLNLAWQAESGQALVAINPRKMLRALENLLHNAIKFTPAGGAISLRLGTEGQQAWLTIEDTGIGIPAELQPVLFDKYSAARRRGLRGEHSNGLGMYIAHEIVRQHKGRIEVFSDAGKGTCVRIELPLVLESRDGPHPATAA